MRARFTSEGRPAPGADSRRILVRAAKPASNRRLDSRADRVLVTASVLLLLVVVFASAPGGQTARSPSFEDGATDDGPSARPEPDREKLFHTRLVLTIWASRSTVGRSEPIEIHARLSNVGRRPIAICAPNPYAESGWEYVEYSLEVEPVDGAPALEREECVMVYSRPIDASDFLVLNPAESVTFPSSHEGAPRTIAWSLDDEILRRPGRYRVRGVYRVRRWRSTSDAQEELRARMTAGQTLEVAALYASLDQGEVRSDWINVERTR